MATGKELRKLRKSDSGVARRGAWFMIIGGIMAAAGLVAVLFLR